ncbi:peptidoglycan DD-metalloendopeptidase family protein [Granulosicoccaceae sp. 1_MG-2023]|nr:peptidoglycan DD-metalloendopeptidase family protein [Granulosicoccaceae sp. 1_MG-2023]
MSQRLRHSVLLLGCLALAGCAGTGSARKPSFAYDKYITRPGDTVESVAWRYKLTPDELRARNRLTGGSILPPGMQLVIAAPVVATTAPQAPVARTESVAVVNTARREPAVVQREPLAQVEIPASVRKAPREEVIETVEFVEPAKRADTSAVKKQQKTANGWMWPASGQIARGFQPNVVNRQGLDITVASGEDIVAAADGTVVYSGQDLASHGKLVILRHDNNLLSAYSMADELYVKEDETVRAGDAIASLKRDQGSSMFHFEIRKNGNPVDPVTYLPKR